MKHTSVWLVAVASVGLVCRATGQEPKPAPAPVSGKAPHAELLGWAHHSSSLFSTGSFCTLASWNFTTRETQAIVDCRVSRMMRLPNHANSLAVGQKTGLVVLGENSGAVEIRDGHSFELQKELDNGAPYSIYAVAISPDEQQVASCATDGTVRLWDLKDPGHPRRLEKASREGERLGALAFSPDGESLASLSRYGRLVLWDTASLKALGQSDVSAGEDAALSFSKKGDRVFVVYRMNLTSWHPEHEPQPKTIVAPESVAPRYPKSDTPFNGRSGPAYGEGIKFAGVSTLSPEGDMTSLRLDGSVAIWDPSTGKILASLAPPPAAAAWENPGNYFECVRYSPNGQLLAATASSGDLFVWNVPDMTVVKR